MEATAGTAPAALDGLHAERRRLCRAVSALHARGWCPGTGGNFSLNLGGDPTRLLITPSGLDKGRLEPEDLVLFGGDGSADPAAGRRRPSAEALLHLAIARETGAAAVFHTHSVAATLLGEHFEAAGGFTLRGYEMLKGLSGVASHEAEVQVLILANSQDMPALGRRVERLLAERPGLHGFLLAGHGLYTWGTSVEEAQRHVEVLEFLMECAARRTPFSLFDGT
jgi:methylthioribulose-1-phosphate dehydratase